ncbi:MAG: DNA polymerase I [Alphaproteobacteria bacterium]
MAELALAEPAPSEKPRLLLIDGSGYIFRAYFALPPLTDKIGTPVGAVFGFCNMLFKLAQDRPNDQMIVVFDKGSHSFRNDMYDQYKANRDEPPEDLRPQFPLVRDAASAFGVPVVELEGYEADDIIATYARQAAAAGRPVTIVSSDKDLMQLIGDGIEMFDPMKSKEIGPDEVMEKFGVLPNKVRDVLALTGDTSDNVPGVPKIGPKTAAQLLEEFGDLEGILEGAPTIKQKMRRENLINYADQARLSYQLVGLCEETPLPQRVDEIETVHVDYAKLLDFAREYNFNTLSKRLEALLAGAGTPAGVDLPETGKKDGAYVTITELAVLDEWLERAKAKGVLAVDTETTSLDVMKAELVGVCLAVEEGEGAYVPIKHIDDFGQLVAGQLDRAAVIEKLRPYLVDPSILKVGHHLKYDLGILARAGLELSPYDDTLMLSYVVDGTKHGHGMDELAELHFGHKCISFTELCGKGKNQITFDRVPVDKASEYAAEDADITLRLHDTLKRQLIEARRTTVYETMERPLVAVLDKMERRGVKVDRSVLQRLSTDFTKRMKELEATAHKQAGHEFNLGSPKQLGEVLFEELGIQGAKKTKTGSHQTGADVLEGLAALGHELPATVLAWRQLQKLTGTYTDALINQISEADGRVHTSYAMAVTSTGRLSSNDPNLQNIPIRTEEGRKIRKAFVAEDGNVLMSADYSQIELRVLAHIADIEALKKAFAEGADIHATTASEMFGVPLDKMDGELRRRAKTINFGIIYGIGPYGLSQRLGIPFEDAKNYIATYFERYPGIKDYMDRAKAEAKEQGYVKTLYGRMCPTPEIKSSNPARRGYAERAAINAPIQGTAADIMKRAMIQTDRALERSSLGAKMLLQVHDELVFEVPEKEAEETAALVQKIMENAAFLSVPLTVEVGTGANWDDAH